MTYDANGNTTKDNLLPANQYSYDVEGRPVSAGGVTITYDALGRAVEMNNNGSYTQFVYSPTGQKFAYMNGQSVQKYIVPLEGGVQAVYNASGFQYVRHADWLGSSRLQLDWNGNLIGDRAYAPFGETYVETGTADRSFTGQTQDVIAGSQGIYDFLFRQQASSQGRWLVPDPAGLAAVDITNPQTWNRYAYVGNNPLGNVDPLGLVSPSNFVISWNAWGNLLQGVLNPLRWQFKVEPPDRAGVGGRRGGSPLNITNPSKSGPQQQTISNRLSELLSALACDPECSSFLAQNGVDPTSTLKAIIDNGVYGHADISMNGNSYSVGATNGGADGMAIVVNNQGAFFNTKASGGGKFSVGPSGYPGGSAQAQGFMLLHELGHTTGVLRPDLGMPKAGQLNDEDIQNHCKKTLDAFK